MIIWSVKWQRISRKIPFRPILEVFFVFPHFFLMLYHELRLNSDWIPFHINQMDSVSGFPEWSWLDCQEDIWCYCIIRHDVLPRFLDFRVGSLFREPPKNTWHNFKYLIHVQCKDIWTSKTTFYNDQPRFIQALFFTGFWTTPTNGFGGFLSLEKKSLLLG